MSVIPGDHTKAVTEWSRLPTSACRPRRCGLFAFAAVAVLPFVPTPSSAGVPPNLSIDDMIAQSGAVVVATVTEIDPRDGLRQSPPIPLTRIHLRTRQVLLGKGIQEEFDLRIRGGLHADGGFGRFSIVRELTVGDTYLLFIRPDYHITPLVDARRNALRLVDFENKSTFVDEAGRGLIASYQHGLLGVGKIAASLHERKRDQQPHSLSVERSQRIRAASSAQELLTLVATRIAEARSVNRRIPTHPLPFAGAK